MYDESGGLMVARPSAASRRLHAQPQQQMKRDPYEEEIYNKMVRSLRESQRNAHPNPGLVICGVDSQRRNLPVIGQLLSRAVEETHSKTLTLNSSFFDVLNSMESGLCIANSIGTAAGLETVVLQDVNWWLDYFPECKAPGYLSLGGFMKALSQRPTLRIVISSTLTERQAQDLCEAFPDGHLPFEEVRFNEYNQDRWNDREYKKSIFRSSRLLARHFKGGFGVDKLGLPEGTYFHFDAAANRRAEEEAQRRAAEIAAAEEKLKAKEEAAKRHAAELEAAEMERVVREAALAAQQAEVQLRAEMAAIAEAERQKASQVLKVQGDGEAKAPEGRNEKNEAQDRADADIGVLGVQPVAFQPKAVANAAAAPARRGLAQVPARYNGIVDYMGTLLPENCAVQ
jgi:hypothetical protein